MKQVLPSEAQALISGITKDPTPFFSKGIAINRTKYVFVRSDPGHAIYCRKGNEGAVAVKTNKCLLIGGYSDGMQAGCCSAVMEKLADYFIANGYWHEWMVQELTTKNWVAVMVACEQDHIWVSSETHENRGFCPSCMGPKPKLEPAHRLMSWWCLVFALMVS